MTRKEIIGKAMYNIIYNTPGASQFTPEWHEKIGRALEEMYDAANLNGELYALNNISSNETEKEG